MEFTITNQEEYNNRPLLDVEFKAKWVAALRSGKYKQGYKYLNQNNCFCCLGVACEIGGLEKEEDGDCVISYWLLNENKSLGLLPDYFLPEITRVGHFKGFCVNNHSSLANLNDGIYNFNQIADVIEKHF